MDFQYGTSSSEFKLDNPPTDCIQRVKFNPTDNNNLLTASWDSKVRLYDISVNKIKAQYEHDGPVLDVAFQNPDRCWSGGTDSDVKVFDFETEKVSIVGGHSQPVKCVDFIPDANIIASASWDRALKFWDPRLSDNSTNKALISTNQLPDRAYTMAVCGDKIIVGCAGRKVVIWDLRNMTSVHRDSLLKYQIRCIEAFPNRKGYVVGSIEGRVAVEYMDTAPEIQKQKYAFKCHRSKDPTTGMEIVYPVNAISFHQRFNTFATGGSDGYVSIWDGQNKKRLVQFHKYPNSISSLSFSNDGNLIAIACSNPQEEESMNQDSIFIRKVHEFESKSKDN